MKWIIGDIHGMFDPLKKLITYLTALEKRPDADSSDYKIEKFIFVGDYIDRGPSGKEVVDYLISLEREKIFLCGNHEDMMINFINNGRELQEYGNNWFRGNNGGWQTVLSFMPDLGDTNSAMAALSPETFKPGEKYIEFFKSLKYSHIENAGGYKFAVTHAGLCDAVDIERQLRIKSHEQLHNLVFNGECDLSETLLWTRNKHFEKFGDYILVHGHTPTITLDREGNGRGGYYDVDSAVPFFKFQGADPVFDFEKNSKISWCGASMNDLISINIDTAAAYGYYLSAIGISDNGVKNGAFHCVRAGGTGTKRGGNEICHEIITVS